MARLASQSEPGDGMVRSPLVRAAERMVRQIEALVTEVASLRDSNAALRQELREALAAFERSSAALSAGGTRHRRAAVTPAPSRRRRRRSAGSKGRATPAAVTTDVVRAVIAKLGQATAAEIAGEITSAGVPVSGRAVRFLAEGAGAETFVGEDGHRRYRL
ncbi:MAG: hypothetical protein ABR564_09560 [Candidatus Dormibacteria bacterium]